MASLKSLLSGIVTAGAAGLIGVAVAQPSAPTCNTLDAGCTQCKPGSQPKASKVVGGHKANKPTNLEGCLCLKNPHQKFCKKGVKYKCEEAEGKLNVPLYLGSSDGGVDAGSDYDAGSQYDAGETLDGGFDSGYSVDSGIDTVSDYDAGNILVDAGNSLDGGFDGGVDAGSVIDAGYTVDAGVNSGDEKKPSNVSKYAGIIVPSFGYVTHDHTLKNTTSNTTGLEEGVLVVPMVSVKGDKVGLVFQYTRDSYNGSSVNGKRPNEDSVTNNDLRIGAVYLSGLNSGKPGDRVVMAGVQYLREMEDGKYTGREVDTTGAGFAGQARLILPHLFELPKNLNLGVDVTGDIQSRAIDSESGDYGTHDSGFISNMQLGGNLVLSYQDFLRLSAGYRFRSVGNTELGVHASNSHYAVASVDGTRQNGLRYGARLNIPTENTGKGLDGRIYAGKGRVGFELVLDRYQQQSQIGPDTLKGSTFYFGGNLVIGTDAEQDISDLLGVRYRR